jgi:hypothetical protein
MDTLQTLKTSFILNTRNLGGWESPVVMENLNQTDTGDLGLSNQKVDDIAAFLLTLTDSPSRQ